MNHTGRVGREGRLCELAWPGLEQFQGGRVAEFPGRTPPGPGRVSHWEDPGPQHVACPRLGLTAGTATVPRQHRGRQARGEASGAPAVPGPVPRNRTGPTPGLGAVTALTRRPLPGPRWRLCQGWSRGTAARDRLPGRAGVRVKHTRVHTGAPAGSARGESPVLDSAGPPCAQAFPRTGTRTGTGTAVSRASVPFPRAPRPPPVGRATPCPCPTLGRGGPAPSLQASAHAPAALPAPTFLPGQRGFSPSSPER